LHFFITRSLSSDSPFQKLKDKGHQVTDLSLVRIDYLDFEKVENCDWIFFYSSNGIKAYFDKVKFDTSINYGVMGTGSAQTFEKLTGSQPSFMGDGTAQFAADFLLSNCKDNKICFAKAASSLSQVEQIMGTEVKSESIIVYSNTKKTATDLSDYDVLIFTSPLNVEAYFDNQGYHNESVFAIGETTAQKVYNLIGVNPHFCKTPSEENLYKLVMETLLG